MVSEILHRIDLGFFPLISKILHSTWFMHFCSAEKTKQEAWF